MSEYEHKYTYNIYIWLGLIILVVEWIYIYIFTYMSVCVMISILIIMCFIIIANYTKKQTEYLLCLKYKDNTIRAWSHYVIIIYIYSEVLIIQCWVKHLIQAQIFQTSQCTSLSLSLCFTNLICFIWCVYIKIMFLYIYIIYFFFCLFQFFLLYQIATIIATIVTQS